MKKILLAIIAIVAAMTSPAAAQVTNHDGWPGGEFYFKDVTLTTGVIGELELWAHVSADAPVVNSFQATFVIPDGFKLGSAFLDGFDQEEFIYTASTTGYNTNNYVIIISRKMGSEAVFPTGDYLVGRFRIRATEDVAPGEYTLSLYEPMMFYYGGYTCYNVAELRPFTITVQEAPEPEQPDLTRYDVNRDGAIDVGDINDILSLILTGQAADYAPRRAPLDLDF